MKKGLILAMISILFLLWIEQGLEVAYIWKTFAKVIVFLLMPLFLMRTIKLSFMNIKNADKKSIRIAVVSGIAIVLIIIGAFILLMPFIDITALVFDLSERVGVNAYTFPFVALYILFGNSLLEEFFFRGYLPNLFKKTNWRWVLPPLLFAVYHIAIFLPWFNWALLGLAVFGLAVGGVIFQLVNERSQTIFPSWIIHMFADIGVLLIGVYMIYFH